MIRIRPAEKKDLPALLEIYNDVIVNTTAVYHFEPFSMERYTGWFEDRLHQGFPVLVALEGELVAGYATFGNFRPWPGFSNTVENSLYVAREHRGKGIGKLLMPPLIDSAKLLGLHTMIAGIDASNEVSIKLHEKFGFKIVANLKEVGFKFGRWLDLVFMQLLLEPGSKMPAR